MTNDINNNEQEQAPELTYEQMNEAYAMFQTFESERSIAEEIGEDYLGIKKFN